LLFSAYEPPKCLSKTTPQGEFVIQRINGDTRAYDKKRGSACASARGPETSVHELQKLTPCRTLQLTAGPAKVLVLEGCPSVDPKGNLEVFEISHDVLLFHLPHS